MAKRIYVLSSVSSVLLVLASFATPAQAACSLAFTSPGDGASVTSPNITVRGQGGGDAVHGDFGTVTATLNGATFFNYSGSFTAAVSFLQSAGVAVTLRTGLNFLSVTGSLSGCSASDSMTVMYDPLVDLGKNKGAGEDDPSCRSSGAPENSAGNPLIFSIGNKYQEEEDYSRSNETFPLRFARSYNSLDGYWVHSYSTRLAITTGKVTLYFADGRQSAFAVSGTTITPSSTELGALTRVGTNWRYTSSSNEVFDFDSTGRLAKWTNPYGLFHQLSYTAGTATVTDTYGNSLSFTQDSRYQPLTMTATASSVSIVYNYDTAKRLQTVVKTTGTDVGTRTFHYENTTYPRFLTGITDERNVRYATWEYDSLGRATKSVHAGDADETLVAYNADSTTTVTNPLGKQTTYHYTVINGVKRITQIEGEPSANCPASNSTYTYDSRGLVASKTDNKGNITTYLYNSRGLETSRTEASGSPQQRVITTTWHATLPLPVEVTMPDQVIAHTYDTQGRVLTKTTTD